MAEVALICGAAGFLGSYTAYAFKESGWSVVGAGRGDALQSTIYPRQVPYITGDFESAEFSYQLIKEVKPDRLLFVAGPADVPRSMIDPVGDFRAQMLPLIQLLWAASKASNPPALILVSSAAVYGNTQNSPVIEDDIPYPISPYGFHKLGQENLLDEFSRLYGLQVCKARVFSTYGRGLRRLAVWEITQRALLGDYKLLGSGMESRDYLHALDVARALECIARSASFSGEVINVASGEELEMRKVALLIYNALGLSAKPYFDGKSVTGSPLRWRANISSLLKLGFRQSISIRDGITDTVSWAQRIG
jgi:UDP-glucose 4-epimerase